MKKVLSLISITAYILFTACEKNIAVSLPAYSEKVSIQSMIEPDSVPVVYFNKTVPYFDKKITFQDLVIRNAQIRLQSSFGNDSLRLDSVFDRIYCEYDYFYKGRLPVQ